MYRMGDAEVNAVARVIRSGMLFRYQAEQSESARLERELARKVGVKYAVATSSGTAALICGMAGLGIGPSDEVIVPSYTFMATALAPLAVGAVPVIAEIDESLSLDPADVERKITRRTKAIIPVHMVGHPCDMRRIMKIAREHGLKVLEDACQADGGSYRGRRLASIGHAGTFSFNVYKIIACGEGGALMTNDREVFEKAVIHHDGGCVFRTHAGEIRTPMFAGWNFRIPEMCSAVMRVQLRRLDGILRSLRARQSAMLAKLKGARNFRVNLLNDPQGDCGVGLWIMFESEARRKAFQEALKGKGLPLRCPLNSGRHVYTNWEPVMQQRGAHHPGRDAFKLASASYRYSPDMCPRSLDILARTVGVPTIIDETAAALNRRARTILEAEAEL